MAVVSLHIYTGFTTKFRSGGGATWEAFSGNLASWVPSQHLLMDTGKPRKTCVEVAGRRTFRTLPSRQQSGEGRPCPENMPKCHISSVSLHNSFQAHPVPGSTTICHISRTEFLNFWNREYTGTCIVIMASTQ